MISRKEKDIIIQTLDPYKPKRIGVFGSMVRSGHTEKSDLDLLVDLEHVNLLDLVGLEEELSRLLNIIENIDYPDYSPPLTFEQYLPDFASGSDF